MVHLDLGNLLIHLRADTTQYDKAMLSVAARMQAMSAKLIALGRSLMFKVTLPLTIIGALSTLAFAKFDDAMTKSLAIMGNVSGRMKQDMKDLARTISIEGVTSATDLAKSYFFLASAGLSAEQSMAALSTVEAFAVAGAFDMAKATDLLTDAQSALGLTVKDATKNMQNMTRVSDVLTGANTLANATTEQFSLALTTQAGPAMKAFNVPLEQGVAILAAYADQGIKGQRAGTMFSRMLRLMTKGIRDNRSAWMKFGITIFDVNGELLPMSKIVGGLSKVLGNMSTKQKGATLEMLGFQARSQQAIMPLLGLEERIARYTQELEKMAGITQEVQDKQLKSFSAQMKIMWNNIVNAAISIGEILAPALLRVNAIIKKGMRGWMSLNKTTQQWVVGLSAAAATIPLVILSLGGLVKVLGVMVGLLTTINFKMFLWMGIALALTAVIYTIRVAWLENFNNIRNSFQQLLDIFKTGYDWLANNVIGPFLNWFKDNWRAALKSVGEEFREFFKNLVGVHFAMKVMPKAGENFIETLSKEFLRGTEQGGKILESVGAFMGKAKDVAIKAFNFAKVVLKEFIKGEIEAWKGLLEAVKKQFGKDVDAILSLIKKKIKILETESARISKSLALPGEGKGAQTPEAGVLENLKTGAARFFRAALIDPRSMQSTNDILRQILKQAEKQVLALQVYRQGKRDAREEAEQRAFQRRELLRGQRRGAKMEGLGVPGGEQKQMLQELIKQTGFMRDIAAVPVIS